MRQLDKFIDEVRRYLPELADDVADVLRALGHEADSNGDALEFLDGICWIVSQPVPLAAKLEAMNTMNRCRGKVRVRFRRRGDKILTRITQR